MHAQVPVCVRLSLSLSLCVWSYFNTFLIFILINVHLSTCHEQFQSSTRIRRRRRRQESRKSSSSSQNESRRRRRQWATSMQHVLRAATPPLAPLFVSLPFAHSSIAKCCLFGPVGQDKNWCGAHFSGPLHLNPRPAGGVLLPSQASSTPTPTLFTYSSLLVLGALGISCTDLRTCSHLPGTWLLKRNLLNICHWLFDFLLTWSHKH